MGRVDHRAYVEQGWAAVWHFPRWVSPKTWQHQHGAQIQADPSPGPLLLPPGQDSKWAFAKWTLSPGAPCGIQKLLDWVTQVGTADPYPRSNPNPHETPPLFPSQLM
jgi:hypothetical protein